MVESLLLLVALAVAAAVIYWISMRMLLRPVHPAVFTGTVVVAFLIGWLVRGLTVQPPKAAPAVVAANTPAAVPTRSVVWPLFHDRVSDGRFPPRIRAGSTVFGSVMVENRSAVDWNPHGNPTLMLGLKVSDAAGHVIAQGRSDLGPSFPPGMRRRIKFQVDPIAVPGEYTLTLDPVLESVAWFADVNHNKPLPLKFTVF